MAISKNWANLRDFLRKSYNREVNEWFADEPDPIPENTGSRKNAKRACLILPKETQNLALMKTLTFRFVVQRVHLRPDVYGIPLERHQAIRQFRPQIVLEFLEDEIDTDGGYSRVDGRISFRLMDETSESLTRTKLTTIANKIKLEFGANNGYKWKKGKDLASYTDKNKGYQLQLLVRTKTDAKEIIGKILDINSDSPSWKYLAYKENDEPTNAYPTIPGTNSILGKIRRFPRRRPIATVRFQYAYCNIHGEPNPIILYDRSVKYLNPLVI